MKKCIYDSNIDDLKLMLFIVVPLTKTLYMTPKIFHLPISCLYLNLNRYLCLSVTKNSILKNAHQQNVVSGFEKELNGQ